MLVLGAMLCVISLVVLVIYLTDDVPSVQEVILTDNEISLIDEGLEMLYGYKSGDPSADSLCEEILELRNKIQ